MQNFVTAAHFARLILELEPTGVKISLFLIINIDICKQAWNNPII